MGRGKGLREAGREAMGGDELEGHLISAGHWAS